MGVRVGVQRWPRRPRLAVDSEADTTAPGRGAGPHRRGCQTPLTAGLPCTRGRVPDARRAAVLRAYLVTGSVRDAAQELDRAPSTVKNTLGRVYERLEVANATQAVWRARRQLEEAG